LKKKRLLVIGLDCATPQLVFDQLKSDMPNLAKLARNGTYGLMKSTIPPITVPAWMAMMTGKDPGELGIYGFRNRVDYSYDGMGIVSSRSVTEPKVWDKPAFAGKKSVLLGIPLTYPPPQVNGWLVSCFLTPDTSFNYTYPKELKDEIKANCGDYIIDVDDFRTDDKQALLGRIFALTENRFKTAEYLMKTKDWDFFMMVEMGPDRLHHGFWKYCDPTHPKYDKDSPFRDAFKDYYSFLDQKIGRLLEFVDNDTAIMIVSDHGAKKMVGGICVNEWLIKNNYLKISEYPNEVVPLSKVKIDWPKTIAWGAGGYYSRIFLNVAGREPQGVIPPSDYEKVRDELAAALESIEDGKGNNIGTKVFKPENVYKKTKRIPPDLIVYFGNLDWRSVGSVGSNKIHTFENDTGPDDANHAEDGIYIYYDGRQGDGGVMENLSIYDIAPQILAYYDD